MKSYIKEHPHFGRCLYADNGVIEAAIPLEYGIRIGHFSFCSGENVFFEQPKDMTDLSTPEGWRVYGGHRLWLAPEGPHDYYPDNEPVSYDMLYRDAMGNLSAGSDACGILISQKADIRIGVKKSMYLYFGKKETGDENRLTVIHRVENTGKEILRAALWAISAMAPGGIEHIPLKRYYNGSMPRHRFATWHYTNLGDERATYTREEITLTHMPIEEKYKIGVGHPDGQVCYENKGVIFILSFPIDADSEYPDGNVSYETFLCRHMTEMESLSPCMNILPGEYAEHREVWELRKSQDQSLQVTERHGY